jgi:hypothetical protein
METMWMAPHRWDRAPHRGLFQRCLHCYKRKWQHPVGWWVPARPWPDGPEEDWYRSPYPYPKGLHCEGADGCGRRTPHRHMSECYKTCKACGEDTPQVKESRMLSCGRCYSEDGEEVHPHPLCCYRGDAA